MALRRHTTGCKFITTRTEAVNEAMTAFLAGKGFVRQGDFFAPTESAEYQLELV